MEELRKPRHKHNAQEVPDIAAGLGIDTCDESYALEVVEGEIVFENAVLFMRDVLLRKKFTDADK